MILTEEGTLMTPSGIVIETVRLRIRSYRDDDLADLVALAGDWQIARWVGTIPHPTPKPMGASGSLACRRTTRPDSRAASQSR
jgi:hypothetical protein